MRVELINYTHDPADVIGYMASICYDADEDHESNIKRARHCKDKGHLATMRFAYATVEISGISRVCSHQLVRVAHAGILQESQRYVKLSNIRYIFPPDWDNMPFWYKILWIGSLELGSWLYEKGVKLGLKKQDARYILSQSCTTRLRMCLNLQGWQDLLRNRTAKATQWEARDVAVAIQNELHSIAPELFDRID